MWARWATFLVWALVAASVLFWGMRLFVVAPAAPAQAQVAQPGAGMHGDWSRLLGVDAAPPEAQPAAEAAAESRYALVGVVSPRAAQAAGEGVALIAVEGKPARAYRVGALVDGQNVLRSVSARGATLGPRGNAPTIALTIAPLAPAATGILPSATAPGTIAPGRPMPPAAGVPPHLLPYRSMPPSPSPPPPPANMAPATQDAPELK
jgi:general secretion pathway protein C